MQAQSIFNFCGNSVSVRVPNLKILNWLTEYSEPFFCKCELQPEWHIELYLDASNYFKLAKIMTEKSEQFSFPLLRTSFHYDQEQKSYLVIQQDPDIPGIKCIIKISTYSKSVKIYIKKYSEEVKYIIARVLRSLLIGLARRLGWILLHASSFKTDSCGVICVGEKGAGKTTVMLSVLSILGGEYVSNDRLMIKKVNCDYLAAGLPYSPAILKSTIFNLGLRTINSRYIIQTNEKKIRFLTSELCRILNVKACGKLKIDKLLIPQFGNHTYIKRASNREVFEVLKKSLLSNICDFQPVWDYIFPAPKVDMNTFNELKAFYFHFNDQSLIETLEG